MAITREIWVPDIIGGLFADDTFAARSTDHTAFSDGRTVHVPNAGAKPAVTAGRSTFPAQVMGRTDVDVTYALTAYSTDPIRVPDAEAVELSYDKRSSVLAGARAALAEKVHTELLGAWVKGATKKGTVTKIDKAAVMAARLSLDKDDVPQGGRCLLLTPEGYGDLLASLSDAEQYALAGSVDIAAGVVGRFMGFDIFMRSAVDSAAASKVKGLAWHRDCVARALGAVSVFASDGDPLYYGDVISVEVRAGGCVVRNDKAGVYKMETA